MADLTTNLSLPKNNAFLGIVPFRQKISAAFDLIDAAFGSIKTGTAVYDPPSLADAAGTTTTVTVTGAALGDFVTGLSFSLDLQGITLTGYVSTANTVAVRFQNESGAPVDLLSGTISVRVRKA